MMSISRRRAASSRRSLSGRRLDPGDDLFDNEDLLGVAPRLVLKYNIRPGLSQAGFLVSLARSCASR